jgi:alpha-galactosidase
VISFDGSRGIFALAGRASVYLVRIRNGQLLHAGYHPVPEGAAFSFDKLGALERYADGRFPWGEQAEPYELPAFGDATQHDSALKITFAQPPAGFPSNDAIEVRDARLRYAGHELSQTGAPGLSPSHGQLPRMREPRDVLRIDLKDDVFEFYVSLWYRLTPERDIIERWMTLDNRCAFPVEIEWLRFGTLNLAPDRYELMRPEGNWGREFHVARELLKPGRVLSESSGLNTGHTANPFFLLSPAGSATEAQGVVYFGALAYSGNWQIAFEVLPSSATRIHAGYHPTDFRLVLAPGETHTTPAFVHGCTAEGWTGASQALHGFINDHVLPLADGHAAERPVLYNSWEAAYFDLAVERQVDLARQAAALGIELFCVDDGWFGARRNDKAGLGDWEVSREVFPDGLAPLIDEVHRLGMQFGLWVEPEMVNPDWVLHYPDRPRTERRNQLILDLGRPEVVEHLFAVLDRLLTENQIDFLKWDMNRYVSEAGSVAGRRIWFAHVAAVYSIIDRLRARHPKLTIESCSGGGGRVDLGILARTDQVWPSDNTDAMHRILIQEGFSHAYPPRVMACWVTDEPNHQTGGRAPLSLRFDCAMRGALGIGSAIDRLADSEREEYKARIAFYKTIRPVIQGGSLYRLERTEEAGRSVWQYLSADRTSGVLSILNWNHRFGETHRRLRLRDLLPDATYAFSDHQGEVLDAISGWQLLTLGFPFDEKSGAGDKGRSATLSFSVRK